MNKQKKYWYYYSHWICPVCFYEKIYKERIYNKPKPKNYSKRHEFQVFYCGCSG